VPAIKRAENGEEGIGLLHMIDITLDMFFRRKAL
jgi:hypothetical protein